MVPREALRLVDGTGRFKNDRILLNKFPGNGRFDGQKTVHHRWKKSLPKTKCSNSFDELLKRNFNALCCTYKDRKSTRCIVQKCTEFTKLRLGTQSFDEQMHRELLLLARVHCKDLNHYYGIDPATKLRLMLSRVRKLINCKTKFLLFSLKTSSAFLGTLFVKNTRLMWNENILIY